jgi:hypothetical protein
MVYKPGLIVYLFLIFLFTATLTSRIFFGIDFGDEFQHYLQLKSITQSGDLFFSDLFFQQSVYLLTYPITKIYVGIFGYESLFLFGRILHAVITLIFFLIILKTLIKANYALIYASIAAISVSLSAVVVGVFSVNYNSMTFLFYALFMVQFMIWDKKDKWIFFMPVSCVLTNPFISIVMFSLVWLRLYKENENKLLRNGFIIQCFCLVILASLLHLVTNLQTIIDSIEFTKSFSIGSALMGSKNQLIVVLMSISFSFLISRFSEKNLERLILILFINLLFFFIVFELNNPLDYKLFRTLSIIALGITLFYKIYFFEIEEDKNKIRWFFSATFISCIIFSISSSNGLNQTFVPLLISIIILFLSRNYKEVKKTIVYISLLFPLFLFSHALVDGYRDKGALFNNNLIEGVPELKYISTTSKKKNYIELIKKEFSFLKDKKLTIIGNTPINYIITGSVPETCMIFMRNSEILKSLNPLRGCLKKKNPEYVLTFLEENKESVLRKEFFPLHKECDIKRLNAAGQSKIEKFYEICELQGF